TPFSNRLAILPSSPNGPTANAEEPVVRCGSNPADCGGVELDSDLAVLQTTATCCAADHFGEHALKRLECWHSGTQFAPTKAVSAHGASQYTRRRNTMSLKNLDDLFMDVLRDTLDAERQITK